MEVSVATQTSTARSSSLAGLLAAALLSGAASPPALARDLSAERLKALSIDELMNLEVTSVSRGAESLSGAAAAIAVVTGEDIRRSGATSVPEALRLVPGLHVAQQTSSSWAVSARGFSSINSEKLLVQSDTRSIYTPLLSGVAWDVQDYLLEDIERIEVIRGPGAALWGSNAVNGVINITTKSARDTQGLYMEGNLGSELEGLAAVRYGGSIGQDLHYRVFAKYQERDDTWKPGATSRDDWHLGHVGFRADWDAGGSDAVTVQGDVYAGTVGGVAPSVNIIGRQGPQGQLDADVSGGNILARWRRQLSETSEMQFRAYYDRTHRDDPVYEDDLHTVDLDFQHRFSPLVSHELTWGLNYRYLSSRTGGKVLFALDPESSTDHLVSAFLQDQIALSSAVRLTLGTKFEHNDFSGYEFQPSLRLAYDVTPRHTLWAAASRAVRVPTRLERDVAIDLADPPADPVGRLLGNKDFDSERMMAHELGWRWQAMQNLSLDVAAFHNRYEGLASLEFGDPFIDPRDGRTVIPVLNLNLTDGNTQGVEVLVNYQPLPIWRLTAVWSYINMSLHPRGMDINRGKFVQGSTPQHQFGLRSSLDLPHGLQLDAQFRALDEIETLPDIVEGTGLPGYAELDIRLAWRPRPDLELSLVGQNLLHDHHREFGNTTNRGEIERAVYGRIALWY